MAENKGINLIYLVFGQESRNFLQVYFSISTFLSKTNLINRIYILTDHADMFRRMDSSVLEIVEVSQDEMQEWRGSHDFFWRIKIKAIQKMVNSQDGYSWLYLDSDTFLFGDFELLVNRLEAGNSLMHLCEGQLMNLKSKTERSMWRTLNGREIGGIETKISHSMWNAGAIGLPSISAPALIQEILDYCDALCSTEITRRLVEQYAFSVILTERTQLLPCNDVIGHYWGNKPDWINLSSEIMLRSFMKKMDFESMVEEVGKMDLRYIPVYRTQPALKSRLFKALERFLPDHSHLCISDSTKANLPDTK